MAWLTLVFAGRSTMSLNPRKQAWFQSSMFSQSPAFWNVVNSAVLPGRSKVTPEPLLKDPSCFSRSGRQEELAMAKRESEPQKQTIERVMHEFKYGELRSGTSGQKVKNRRQAVAIALSEAGASNQQTPKENQEHLRHTKAKERLGETAKDEAEGKISRRRSSR
jgi:hypothetical protein